jgi:hypothetical protein
MSSIMAAVELLVSHEDLAPWMINK